MVRRLFTRHVIVNHLYALAAFGNTLGIIWILREIALMDKALTMHIVVGAIVMALYALIYLLVAVLRRH